MLATLATVGSRGFNNAKVGWHTRCVPTKGAVLRARLLVHITTRVNKKRGTAAFGDDQVDIFGQFDSLISEISEIVSRLCRRNVALRAYCVWGHAGSVGGI